MNTQTDYIKLVQEDILNTGYTNANFKKHIEELQAVMDSIPEAQKDNAEIVFDTGYEYGTSTVQVYVQYKRSLTTEEIAREDAYRNAVLNSVRQQELEQLKHLQEKYKGEI